MRRSARRLGSTVVTVLMLGSVASVAPALASENGGSGSSTTSARGGSGSDDTTTSERSSGTDDSTTGGGGSGSDDATSGGGGGGADDATTGGATGTGGDDGATRSGGGRVTVQGDCSKRADWKLKAKPEDGRLKVEFEVDSNKVGRSWMWTVRSNGFVVASGRRTTQGPSGSFSVERRTSDDSGRQRISATARNSRTREVCRASLTI